MEFVRATFVFLIAFLILWLVFGSPLPASKRASEPENTSPARPSTDGAISRQLPGRYETGGNSTANRKVCLMLRPKGFTSPPLSITERAYLQRVYYSRAASLTRYKHEREA